MSLSGALLDMGCYLVQFATLAHQSVVAYKSYLQSTLPHTHKSPSHTSDSSSALYDNAVEEAIVYPYQFSSMLPDEISANGLVGSDGVDIETSFLLRVCPPTS
jgi:hypothetical protein